MQSEMKHLHECFMLTESCASTCKVNHLMRTIPPTQVMKFLKGFVELKNAMENILGRDLNKEQWLTWYLAAKYAGLGLRNGMLIAGAQHVMS